MPRHATRHWERDIYFLEAYDEAKGLVLLKQSLVLQIGMHRKTPWIQINYSKSTEGMDFLKKCKERKF